MNRPCAICIHLALPPRTTGNTISVIRERLSVGGEHTTALDAELPVCPQHAVDVYCGRIPGIAMSWRVLPEPTRR